MDRDSADGELESAVTDGSDVCHEPVSKVRAHRDLHRIQEVAGVADVRIDAAGETVVEESVVHSDIPCHRSLPPDRRIVCIRIEHAHVRISAHVVLMVGVAVDVVEGEVGIVSDSVLLAGESGRESQFHL